MRASDLGELEENAIKRRQFLKGVILIAETQTPPVWRKDWVGPAQITSDSQAQGGSTEKAETSSTGTKDKHWKKKAWAYREKIRRVKTLREVNPAKDNWNTEEAFYEWTCGRKSDQKGDKWTGRKACSKSYWKATLFNNFSLLFCFTLE